MCLSVCVFYLRDEAVQLPDTVLVGGVCGQPFWDVGLSFQLFSDLHLLPEHWARPHVSTRLTHRQISMNTPTETIFSYAYASPSSKESNRAMTHAAPQCALSTGHRH